MCETMQKIVDRERDDADVKARMDIALNLWSEGEHDLANHKTVNRAGQESDNGCSACLMSKHINSLTN